jgi:RimJ/RimL family protein N-acetyltransferase
MATIAETPRLVLRTMTEDDAANLVELSRNPNVLRFIVDEPSVTTIADALTVLRERVFPQYAFGLGRWACIEKSSGAFLGWCGVKHILEDGEYDIGYRLLEEYWGRGYATEAAAATCDFARAHLRGERVVAKAAVDNTASRRVLEKVGLVFEGEEHGHGARFAVYRLDVGPLARPR